MVGKRGHLDTDINGRGNDYDNDVITDGLATKGFSHQRLVFLPFFFPSSQKRYGRGFNMVNDVQAGLSSRTYPERWLTTSLWDGSFALNEPAKRRNLLKGLG